MADIDWSLAKPPPNFFETYNNAFQTGRQLAIQRASDQALQTYANDPDAGINAMRAFDPERAAALQTQRQAQQDREANIGAAGAYADGDTAAALRLKGRTGDLAGVSALQTEIINRHMAQLQFAQQEAGKIFAAGRGITDPAQRTAAYLAAFDAEAPNYTQFAGQDAEHIAALRQQLAANPEQVLRTLMAPPKLSLQAIGPNEVGLLNETTGEMLGRYHGRQFIPFKRGEGVREVGGDDGEGGGEGGPPPPPAPPTAPGAHADAATLAPGGRLDPQAFYRAFILPHEGGLNPSDMNGSPTNYGFNQAANPDINVHDLTPDSAAARFASTYFPHSGAGNLPPAMAAIHADTSFINPHAAERFLQQAGGDPAKYMALRAAWMEHMIATNPAAAKYAHAWRQRNADLSAMAGQLGGGQTSTAAPAAPAAPAPAGGGLQATPGLSALARQFGGPGGAPAAPTAPTAGPAPGGSAASGEQPNGPHIRTLIPAEQEFSDPQTRPGLPGLWMHSNFTNEWKALDHTAYGPEQIVALRQGTLTNEDYKQATAAMTSYKAMIANADLRTGPSAYAMLDTFARSINPDAVARQQVLNSIEEHLSPTARAEGWFRNLAGQGNLTPEARQQILDAVLGFVQSHWDQAHSLIQSNQDLIRRVGGNPDDVTVPLDARPTRYVIGSAAKASGQHVAAHGGLTPQQIESAKRITGGHSSAASGSAQNPFTPNSEAEYNHLPSGAHYIFTDGRVMVKP